MERVEDAALLTASAKFTDDMPMQAGTLHVAFLRSPHASADILSIDVSAAESRPGVAAVLTGEDIKQVSSPFLIVVKEPMDQWCLPKIKFVQEENGAENTVEMHIPELIIAGWTGSDEKAVNENINELAAIGIPRPTTVPIYFRVAATRRASM